MPTKKLAIVGSGCSGLAAFWALKATDDEVHLYESQDRLGGHTNTVPFKTENGIVQVDTGFIVMNSATYPNFIAFLEHIGVEPVPTDMTFGVSRDGGLFEWSGTSLSSIFAQRQNLFSLKMWRMIFDIVRFNQYALDLLSVEDESEEDPTGPSGRGGSTSSPEHQQSIGDYLEKNNYSHAFRNDYLIPMTASIWSTSPDKTSLEFPAITLARFLWNHHLLNTVAARPQWMTIPGGSQRYIDAIMDNVPKERVHLKTAVQYAQTLADQKVRLHFKDGGSADYDHVVIATHGNTAASIIGPDATEQERQIMSCFKTSRNTAVLHCDLSLMPKREETWSSWNYMTTSPSKGVDSTTFGNVLVTLNPLHRPAERTIQGEWTYHHPLYDSQAIRAQKLLPKIQNTRGISFAGAWTKYGFHEDGFSSGLKVAIEHLGAELPFDFVDSTFSRGRRPNLGRADHVLRLVLSLVQAVLVLTISMLGIVNRYTLTNARVEKRGLRKG